MCPSVSIVMPAYRAQETIARAVASVLAQTHEAFEVIVVADDGEDYEAVLGRRGIRDARLRFFESGHIGGGSPHARNKGLGAARHRFSAILDADDRFAPEKLARALPLAEAHGLVSTALRVMAPDGTVLRLVGDGPDQLLSPALYKFCNFSMDSMLVYDRERADPRFDPELPAMTDLDFLLRLFQTIPACFHIGTPLHDYVKMPLSISNGPGFGKRMIAAKKLLLERLTRGDYGLADPAGAAGVSRFLTLSLAAERSFTPSPGEAGPALFEDHLAPLLGDFA